MSKINNQLNEKVKSYVDKLFSGVGASQQLYELKEEIAINLKDKTLDYIARGMDERQAFQEAVISMGDLSGLVADMRLLGQDKARQAVYSTMTARISLAGIILGVLITLFGILTIAMLYFMELPGVAVAGSGIFIVVGGALITYSLLTRETAQKYAMNKIRAALYALAIGLILFGMNSAFISRYATGEMFIAIGSLMVFLIRRYRFVPLPYSYRERQAKRILNYYAQKKLSSLWKMCFRLSKQEYPVRKSACLNRSNTHVKINYKSEQNLNVLAHVLEVKMKHVFLTNN